ncbi:chloride channel protein [Actinophytocola sp.]|uniref:chloride channel protein n=1 Tax=Actinophytocola sp. TaxID=1872138 RepID=UPI0025BFAE9B|nr:chloride channel protein [Actinophytocola sp.]
MRAAGDVGVRGNDPPALGARRRAADRAVVRSPELAAAFGLGVAGLGVLGGLVGAAFGVSIHTTQHATDRVWRGPSWLRPAAGGVLLGPLLLALPQLYGVGNTVVGPVVAGVYPLALLLALAVGKIVAVCLTLAVGGVGGVFAPLLFVGATLGAAWGTATGHVAGYALVGMTAVVAGAARIPATAAVLVVELSGLVGLAPHALVAAAVAGRVISPDTVYTRTVARAGVGPGVGR